MLSKLLVPLDGTPESEAVLPLVRWMAEAAHTRLVLLRVAKATDGGLAAAMERATDYLQQQARGVEHTGVTVEVVTAAGDPAQVIVEQATAAGADAIAMATHGRSGIDRLMAGSVAEGLVRLSPVPVLLVRAPHEGEPALAVPKTSRLMVPLDGSELAEIALPIAAETAKQMGSELLLMHAVMPPEGPVTSENGTVIAYLDQRVEALKRDALVYLRDAGSRVAAMAAVPVVSVGEPAEAIARAAAENDAALIVMATHGRTGAARALLGSVADEVVRTSNHPVLLVRRPAAPSEAAIGEAAGERLLAPAGS